MYSNRENNYLNHNQQQQHLISPNHQIHIESNDNFSNSLVNKKNKQYNLDEITTSLNYYPSTIPNNISLNYKYNIKYRFEF